MSETTSSDRNAQGGELIASASVGRDTLTELVQPFPADAYFLGEHLPDAVVDDDRQMRRLLVRFARLNEMQQERGPLLWSAYTWGRVFTEEGELRWDGSEGPLLRVVYLGHERLLPARLREGCRLLTGVQRSQVSYYLFGERPHQVKAQEVGVGAEEEQRLFLETRIPRLLFYPAEQLQAKRIMLKTYCYHDLASGAVAYCRFAGLEAESSGPERKGGNA
ncbi:CRISPR-associated protein Csx19 [Thermogemmatispora sp.]|uniref:type III-D CRISPR-associated protein Csx19 n=1 Tax=Thermogemmatispora sp. TaxID=1968838 RepID=UPI0035E45AB1